MPARRTFGAARFRGPVQFDGGATSQGRPVPAFKEYVALLTQEGNNPPVANVIRNTLGFTPIWKRSGVALENDPAAEPGRYYFNFPGLAQSKFFAPSFRYLASNGAMNDCRVEYSAPGVLEAEVAVEIYALQGDDSLINTPFEIRVYP
ncbi:MAG TPA: hypothetical protein VF659_15410 [Pyrinomonadaceae bacterium]|jgi:hypothetical protein